MALSENHEETLDSEQGARAQQQRNMLRHSLKVMLRTSDQYSHSGIAKLLHAEPILWRAQEAISDQVSQRMHTAVTVRPLRRQHNPSGILGRNIRIVNAQEIDNVRVLAIHRHVLYRPPLSVTGGTWVHLTRSQPLCRTLQATIARCLIQAILGFEATGFALRSVGPPTGLTRLRHIRGHRIRQQ